MKLARIFLNIFSKGKKPLSNHNRLCLIAVRQKKIPPFVFFFDGFLVFSRRKVPYPAKTTSLQSAIHPAWTVAQGSKNVKKRSQKRPLKMLQLERKIEMKTAFFTLPRGRFSLFPRSKHSFYRPKAMLLHRNRYAFKK